VHQTGELNLLLGLSYSISREGLEFRLVPDSPIYEGAIKVTPLQSAAAQKATEQPWWWRIFAGISERIFKVFLFQA
jgi:hypothetical protein